MVRSLAARPGLRTQTEADQDRAGAPTARAGKCQLRSLAWGGEGGGGGGGGERGERFNVVNHTQVLERRSAVQFGSGFGPKCVFTLDGSQE